MQGNSKLLGDVNMRETRWVRDDGIGNERLCARVERRRMLQVQRLILLAGRRWRSEAISRLDTRSPTALEDLLHPFSPLGDLAALQCIEAGHQAGILDHEGHELGRIAADAEELQSVLLDELLESRVSGNANPVAVRLGKNFAQGHEGLDVAARADDLNDDIKTRRRDLPRLTAEAGGDVSRRERPVWELGGEELVAEGWGEKISETSVLLVDVDVDSAVIFFTLSMILWNLSSKRGTRAYS
jgi:hypothetical protein